MASQPLHFMRLLTSTIVATVMVALAASPVWAQELGQECTNSEVGYNVAFPTGWYVNERVEGGDLADVAACRFFSPQDFDVQPQSGIAGIAVAIDVGTQGPPGALTPDTEVAGRPAFITETTVQEDGFEPAGTHHYDYWIELGPDTWLVAGTSDAPNFVGNYVENKAVLDAMMGTLSVGPDRLPDAAMSPPSVGSVALVGLGLVLILAALHSVRGVREQASELQDEPR